MNVIKKLKVKSIAFCLNSNPANRFKFILAKSDQETEQDKIDDLNDVLLGVDSYANTLNEGLRIAKSKINAEDLENLREDVAETLGLQVKKASGEHEIDHYPSVYELRRGEIIEKSDNDEEEDEMTDAEFIASCRDKETARRLLGSGMEREEILKAVGTRGVKKSIDEGLEKEEKEEEFEDKWPSLSVFIPR